MAAISVRDLDDRVRDRLRVRAAQHGRSMESEIRAILCDAVRDPSDSGDLFQAILDRFGENGGVGVDLPPRTTSRRAVDFTA